MNRRAFLVALACVPVAVVAKAQLVEPGPFVCGPPEPVIGTYGPTHVVWRKTGPTVVTFPAGARLKRATLDRDGSIVLCYKVGDRFFTMKQDAKGVYR